jgi:F-type H+-transporting ATPase subunit gamma
MADMAVGKEIRGKIKSFENTKKITKAMEMVSAAKMRKAQERMRAARPYAEKIRNITANLARRTPSTAHPFMRKVDEFKSRRLRRRHHRQGPVRRLEHERAARGDEQHARRSAGWGERQAVAIGNKGLGFLNRHRCQGRGQRRPAGRPPHLDKMVGPVKVMLDAFVEGELDAV